MKRMIAWFDERITKSKSFRKSLLKEARRDEAEFEGISGNVYDIFRTVLLTGERLNPGNRSEQTRFFREKINQIPRNWEKAYRLAEEHGDFRRAQVEHVKLETANLIRAQFLSIQEDSV